MRSKIAVLGLVLLGACLGLVSSAMADDTFTINVACQRSLSVNITTSTTDGAASYNAAISTSGLPTAFSTVISTPLVVWNNSPANSASVQNYSLQVTGGSSSLDTAANWSTTAGSGQVDKWHLAAVFTNVTGGAATTADFSTDTVDLLTGTAEAWAAAGKFSPATGGKIYNPAGEADETKHPRNTSLSTADLLLWIGVGTPIAVTSTGANGAFTVTVSAQ